MPDPANKPKVRKHPNGRVWAWTTDIAKFCGRARHDNFLTAVRKVIAEEPEFAAKNFRPGTYQARNKQLFERFRMTREGFVAMCRKMHGMRDCEVLYLDAYDLCEYQSRKRREKAEPLDLDPAIIPDDHNVVLDLSKEPGGPEEHARRIIEVSGATETPELMAKILHAMPPALEEYAPPLNDPVVHADGMRVYATTMDIAAYFRKRHDHVLASVREIIALQPEFGLPNFREITYADSHGREQPAFEVTKAGFALAVGGFTGAKALEFRIRYIQRFEEMEAALKTVPDGVRRYGCAEDLLADPHTLLKLAVGYAEKIQTLSGENERLETQVSVLEPKAAALDRLSDKAGTMNLRSAAKALGFGPDFFKRRLEQLDSLFREDGRLVAYQRHIDAGLFVHKPVVLSHRDGTEFIVSQPLVTAKGLARLAVAFGVGVQAVLGQGVLGLSRDDGLSDGEAVH
jgi:Rha family phage regulatory protein